MTDADRTPPHETPHLVQLKILRELEKQTALLTEMRDQARATEVRGQELRVRHTVIPDSSEDPIVRVQAARGAFGLTRTPVPLPTAAEIRSCINRRRQVSDVESPQ